MTGWRYRPDDEALHTRRYRMLADGRLECRYCEARELHQERGWTAEEDFLLSGRLEVPHLETCPVLKGTV